VLRAIGDPLGVISMTSDPTSGWLPFTFGEPLRLPEMDASFSMFCLESCGPVLASEAITGFDIRSADFQPIPGAYVQFTPDPATFTISGCGLLAVITISGYARKRKRCGY
jgi:hypothetical protein